jgi:putative transposase
MARRPRFNLPGVPQHVIQRGNNREPCFYSEEDYAAYLEFLAIAAEKTGCQLHAYVLMTNHVHMLITPMQEHGISALMQSLGKRYVQYINKTYRRTGTLWEGRYKASLIDSQHYLLTCMRYIELNPVRANMVEVPSEYRWSSYGFNGTAAEDKNVSPHPLYIGLGETKEERCFAYRELFRHKMDNTLLHDIRESVNQDLVLGRDDFKDKVDMMLKRSVRKGIAGRPCVKEEEGIYYVY